MEITKDGETILMNDNILNEKTFMGGKKEAMVLKKSEGQLSIETGFGGAQIGLSENEDILRVADQSYKRIDNNRLGEIRSEIEQKKAEREKNSKICTTLEDEYKAERKTISDAHKKDWKMRNTKFQELRERYKAKEKSIPNCHARIM